MLRSQQMTAFVIFGFFEILTHGQTLMLLIKFSYIGKMAKMKMLKTYNSAETRRNL